MVATIYSITTERDSTIHHKVSGHLQLESTMKKTRELLTIAQHTSNDITTIKRFSLEHQIAVMQSYFPTSLSIHVVLADHHSRI
jgi:hypothetical protein